MNTKILVVLAILGLFIVACTTPQQSPADQQSLDETVKIGVMVPLTGESASYGLGVKRGIELAKKELSADSVEIIYEDSKCGREEAMAAITKLISIDKVQAVIGEVCSEATLAAARVAEENEVVLISPSTTSPQLTDAGAYIFRVIPSDALEGNFAADLVYGKGLRRLGILHSNDDYGIAFKDILTQEFSSLGGAVVASEVIENGAVDARTQLTKIKNEGADSIYVISNAPDAAVAALKQIQELGISAYVFGSKELKSEYITENAKEAAEGFIVSSVTIGTAEFLDSYHNEHGEAPLFSAQGYDAFKAVYLALEGATTTQELRDNVMGVEFDGASGRIAFDSNGDVSANYEVYVVEDGGFNSVNAASLSAPTLPEDEY